MAKPLVVDFTGVEAGGGGRTRVPEDDYRVKVKTVKFTESKAGNPMLVWDFEITDGKMKGKKLRDRTVLTPESLWKLKQLLEAMGLTVPNKKAALDLSKYVGRELGVTAVDDDPYEGKISSKISDYISMDVMKGLDVDAEDEDEDEEEEPVVKKTKKSKKGKKAKPAEDDEEIEEMDLDEI